VITLKYSNSGEEFHYRTPANTTQIYVPASDQPGNPSSPQCAQRNVFSIEVQAIRPNSAPIVGTMASEGACGI
jgi:hypothetical protein